MNDFDPAQIMAEHECWIGPTGNEYCRACVVDSGPWPCLPYRLAEKVADAWDEGFRKAGRLIIGLDSEPWPPAPNPYREVGDL